MLKEKERRRHIRICNCFGSIWNNSLNVNKSNKSYVYSNSQTSMHFSQWHHSPNNTDRSTLNPSKIYAMKGISLITSFDQLTDEIPENQHGIVQ